MTFELPNYEYSKYVCCKETLRDTINTFGVAIIPNVLDSNECNQFIDETWNYFEHITQNWQDNEKINRNNTMTYKHFYKLYPSHSMLYQYFNIGHSQALWNIRQNPKIINIFSEFWNTDDLMVSFDGMSFSPPHEITGRGYYKKNLWFHTDQSFQRNQFECIQSWVTAYNVEEGDSTLYILENSHLFHSEFAEQFNESTKEKKDYYKLNNTELNFYIEKKCTPTKIVCPAGSLVLWDSRTIHCGTEALKTRTNTNFRCVAYLSYMPRHLSTKQSNSKKRIHAFENMRTCSHNSVKSRLFSKQPQTYGKPLPQITSISPPILTNIGKNLI
jgi:ectoine hydroxylase-related dioxygenase (phytanoyl-CoA dioxygenase family)